MLLAGLASAAATCAAGPSASAPPAAAPSSAAAPPQSSSPFIVGSKRFTESYILGEIVRLAASSAGPAEHRQGLGNTAVVLAALRAGSIDAYPEYVGTIDAEILGHRTPSPRAQVERELAAMGLGLGVPLGFSDGYALAMPQALAEQFHVRSVSDLVAHPGLVLGLSHEFLGRQDGWPGLARTYGLPQRPVGIDHGLAYDALATGRIAVTDVYTTDARIAERHLRVLDDDRRYFPSYDAVLLYRLDAVAQHAAAWAAIQRLQGRIPVDTMIAMNVRAEIRHEPFDQIAREFMAGEIGGAADAQEGGAQSATGVPSGASAQGAGPHATPAPAQPPAADSVLARVFADDLGPLVAQHLLLVGVAVVAACVLGIPLGAAAAAWPRVDGPVMAFVGVLQTIPSLALLAMLIPLLGRIGTAPALVALTLYALLPIARNTATGLAGVPRGLRDSATALGLTTRQRWLAIDLPLAAPTLIAGVKTAAVITVGTATIAAFVGAGGLGERIVTGLALNDHAMLLAGALPAAALALVAQGLFGAIEWWLSPLARARRRARG